MCFLPLTSFLYLLNQVMNFTEVWREAQDNFRNDINDAWHKLAQDIEVVGNMRAARAPAIPRTSSWQKVRWGLTAVIAVLSQAGSKAFSPTTWLIDGKLLKWTSSPETRVEAFALLRKGLMKEKWIKAGEHFGGGGLEQGDPSFQAFDDAKKFLLKHGKSKAATLLWKAVTGGAAI